MDMVGYLSDGYHCCVFLISWKSVEEQILDINQKI